MPRRAPELLAEFARMWDERGIRAWAEGWWATPMRVGDQIGRIVGAPAGSTVMQQNVAIAEAIVLSCFRPVDPARNRVVYERANFPSVRYLYQAQPDLEVVVCEDDEEIVERIDERTLLVPISHVLFKESEIQDVEPIVRRAHEVGAHVILDCYQSAGIVPVDVTALGVDFAVGGSVKWLCGGPANGWLYVRPDLAELLRPTYTGWQAHERPFAFEEELEYSAGGTARFLTGTPNPAAHMAGTAGYDLIEEIGVARIRENSLRQTELLIGLADAAGLDGTKPARSRAARRNGDDRRPRRRGRLRGARAARDPRRLPARSGHPPRRALLHDGRRASLRGRRRSSTSSRRAPTSAISALPRSTGPERTLQIVTAVLAAGCPLDSRAGSSYDPARCPCKRARSSSRRSSRPSRRRSSSPRCCPRSSG